MKALASGLTFPRAFAMSGNNLFFSENDPERDFGSIKRMSTGGGPVSTVVQDVLALSMAADASGLYYSGIDLRTFEPGIRHLARSGGTPSTLVHEVFAESLRIIGNDLYYVNLFEDTPTIEAVPMTGGAARIIRSVDFFYPRFTFDSCLLYYGTGEGVERAAQ